jgi:hypothetical protein
MIKGKKAIVEVVQVGGWHECDTLQEVCESYLAIGEGGRDKICFVIRLDNGEIRQITVRQEDNEMVAYGDFSELPSFIEYAFLLREQGKI